LSEEKAWALPTFHASTATDNASWEIFSNKQIEMVSATNAWKLKLPAEGELTQDIKDELEMFVCLKYCPKAAQITWF